jgi:hypothetical protein
VAAFVATLLTVWLRRQVAIGVLWLLDAALQPFMLPE